MTLREVIANLETISDELVIFATKRDENWLLDGRAALLLEEDMGKLGAELEDLTYFLEVCVAKETLEVWSNWRGREPLQGEREEAVVYYATYDTWLPPN